MSNFKTLADLKNKSSGNNNTMEQLWKIIEERFEEQRRVNEEQRRVNEEQRRKLEKTDNELYDLQKFVYLAKCLDDVIVYLNQRYQHPQNIRRGDVNEIRNEIKRYQTTFEEKNIDISILNSIKNKRNNRCHPVLSSTILNDFLQKLEKDASLTENERQTYCNLVSFCLTII
jgi:hypothetical protein